MTPSEQEAAWERAQAFCIALIARLPEHERHSVVEELSRERRAEAKREFGDGD